MVCLFLAVVCFAHRLSRFFVRLGVYAHSSAKLLNKGSSQILVQSPNFYMKEQYF